jgi:hypothetical protein
MTAQATRIRDTVNNSEADVSFGRVISRCRVVTVVGGIGASGVPIITMSPGMASANDLNASTSGERSARAQRIADPDSPYCNRSLRLSGDFD